MNSVLFIKAPSPKHDLGTNPKAHAAQHLTPTYRKASAMMGNHLCII